MIANRLTLKLAVALIMALNGLGISANAAVLSTSKQELPNLNFNGTPNSLSQAMLASLTYSAVPNSSVDTLVCYMQTADGRTLDLGNFCGNSTKDEGAIKKLLVTKQCQSCNLSGANLSGTDLSGANLKGATLSGTDLRGAKLNGTIMPDGSISQG